MGREMMLESGGCGGKPNAALCSRRTRSDCPRHGDGAVGGAKRTRRAREKWVVSVVPAGNIKMRGMRTVGKSTRSPSLDMTARCYEGRAERPESPARRISAAELCGRVHAAVGAACMLALVASALVLVLHGC